MKNNLFIVVLKYLVPLETIDHYRSQHLEFLDAGYAQGILLASGPQVPRNGGILIAKCGSKVDLEEILKHDPFAIHQLAEYHIYEFTPTKYCEKLFHFDQ